jgi:hypothetical protein
MVYLILMAVVTHDALELVGFVGGVEEEINWVEIFETKLQNKIAPHDAEPQQDQLHVDDEAVIQGNTNIKIEKL